MRSFEYARAATVEEAIRIADGLQTDGQGADRSAGAPAARASFPAPGSVGGDGHDGAVNGVHGYVAAALSGHGAPRFLAGGTDLLTLMKADVAAPGLLIDVKRAADLPRGIEQRHDRLT